MFIQRLVLYQTLNTVPSYRYQSLSTVYRNRRSHASAYCLGCPEYAQRAMPPTKIPRVPQDTRPNPPMGDVDSGRRRPTADDDGDQS